ncbi:MAG: type II secretion system F family protein [Candidatus Diapherotrites archaeon]
MRVRFMLFSIEDGNALPSRVVGIGTHIVRFFPSLDSVLKRARLPIAPENYAATALLSGIGYGVFFGVLFTVLSFYSMQEITLYAFHVGIALGMVGFLSAFVLHMVYPHILAQKTAGGVEQGLMYALRSLQIQVNSGVGLYDAMVNVARSDYGMISDEFETVVQEINAGVNEAAALERLALRTDSAFLKKTIWQLVTNIRSGSSMSAALQSIVTTLTEFQSRSIKNYAAELNMWILIYLLVAAALPTIGITFMVILSSIGGSDISPDTIYQTVGFAFLVQIILIGFIGSRAPRGY